MSQNLGASCLRSLTSNLAVSQGSFNEGGTSPKIIPMALASLKSLLVDARGNRFFPHGPFHRVTHNMAAFYLSAKIEREREREREMGEGGREMSGKTEAIVL